MVSAYDKALFMLALAGSSLYLLQQVAKGLSILFAGRTTQQVKAQDSGTAPAAPGEPAAQAVSSAAPAPSKSAADKELALQIERQALKIKELTEGLAYAQSRLSVLEAPKPRASRKTAPVAQPVAPDEHDGYPPVDAMTTIPETAPGDFEKV